MSHDEAELFARVLEKLKDAATTGNVQLQSDAWLEAMALLNGYRSTHPR